MPNVVMYTKQTCPYCFAAKRLLKSKNVDYCEIAIDADAEKREEMIQRSGRRTVPQIFIDEQPLGGYDDIAALESTGELDRLLGLSD